MKKIHFAKFLYVACGREAMSVEYTNNSEEVTCKQCKKTEIYKKLKPDSHLDINVSALSFPFPEALTPVVPCYEHINIGRREGNTDFLNTQETPKTKKYE